MPGGSNELSVQPVSDALSTAIAVAYHLAGGVAAAENDDDQEKVSREQAQLVGELARTILDAARGRSRSTNSPQ